MHPADSFEASQFSLYSLTNQINTKIRINNYYMLSPLKKKKKKKKKKNKKKKKFII